MYAKSGVDFVFLDAPETEDQVKQIPKLVNAPVMLNLIEGGKTPLFTFKEVKDMGYKILAIPLTALYSGVGAMLSALRALKERGYLDSNQKGMITFKEFSDIVGLFDLLNKEKEYAD